MYNERLRELRRKKDISQQVVADYLNITKQAYSLYELGKREPDFETLLKLGEFFDVSTDYLLRGKDKEEPINDSDLKFALFGDVKIDDEVLDEVRHYAKIAKQMREERNKNGKTQ